MDYGRSIYRPRHLYGHLFRLSRSYRVGKSGKMSF